MTEMQVVALVCFVVLIAFLSFVVSAILSSYTSKKAIDAFVIEILVIVTFLLGMLLFIGLGVIK